MITSASNEKVKRVAALGSRAKERRQAGEYVVEGVRMFLEAPMEEILRVYVAEDFAVEACMKRLDGLPVETVSTGVFRKMSNTESPQGILCVMRMKSWTPEDLLRKPSPFLMVLEELQDPGNLGTILRTGEGAGIDGVIMSRDCADIYNPKTIRATMGSIYRVPFLCEASLRDTAKRLKEAGVSLFAACPEESMRYDEGDYRGGCAFLIGNEGNGLRPETAALADARIRIPMAGCVESLNAAMASGILMYEAARQRRKAEGSGVC